MATIHNHIDYLEDYNLQDTYDPALKEFFQDYSYAVLSKEQPELGYLNIGEISSLLETEMPQGMFPANDESMIDL